MEVEDAVDSGEMEVDVRDLHGHGAADIPRPSYPALSEAEMAVSAHEANKAWGVRRKGARAGRRRGDASLGCAPRTPPATPHGPPPRGCGGGAAD